MKLTKKTGVLRKSTMEFFLYQADNQHGELVNYPERKVIRIGNGRRCGTKKKIFWYSTIASYKYKTFTPKKM